MWRQNTKTSMEAKHLDWQLFWAQFEPTQSNLEPSTGHVLDINEKEFYVSYSMLATHAAQKAHPKPKAKARSKPTAKPRAKPVVEMEEDDKEEDKDKSSSEDNDEKAYCRGWRQVKSTTYRELGHLAHSTNGGSID